MNYYENIIIIEPTLSEEEVEVTSQKVKDLIKKSEGEVLKEERWGKKKLAYELNKRSEGYYILYNFKSHPSSIKKLEDYYRISDPIFKHMILKLGKKQVATLMDELKQSPQSTSQESDREE